MFSENTTLCKFCHLLQHQLLHIRPNPSALPRKLRMHGFCRWWAFDVVDCVTCFDEIPAAFVPEESAVS